MARQASRATGESASGWTEQRGGHGTRAPGLALRGLGRLPGGGDLSVSWELTKRGSLEESGVGVAAGWGSRQGGGARFEAMRPARGKAVGGTVVSQARSRALWRNVSPCVCYARVRTCVCVHTPMWEDAVMHEAGGESRAGPDQLCGPAEMRLLP